MKNQKKNKHQFNWADGVLMVIGICVLLFIHRYFEVVERTGVEPAALATAFFAFIGTECVILWRIHENNANRDSKLRKPSITQGFTQDITQGDDIQYNDIGDINGEG